MKKSMKKLASAVLAAAMLLTTPLAAQAAWANPFTDVNEGDWYYNAVEYVNSEGLFNGTEPDQFSPNTPMTRGMFVTVLGKFANINAEAYSSSTFTDVSPTAYYAPYVEWAAESGLVSGVGGGKFAPGNSITREQMAIIFYKYAKTVGADTSVTPDNLLSFPDGLNTSRYAQQAMAWAVTHGVLSGSDGKLVPQGTATRTQTAQIIYNAKDLLTTQVDTPPADAVWVVDQFGHFITTEKYGPVPIPGTEVGHWEEDYDIISGYECNTCGFFAETYEEINKHLDDSIIWVGDHAVGCGGWSLSAREIPNGEMIWVVDKEADYEYKWITEHIWVEEVGHWE